MKRLTIMLIGLFMVFGSLSADEVVVNVPLDIDGLPNNGNIIDWNGVPRHITHAHLIIEMLGCTEERKFNKWIPLTSAGIHRTVTIRKTFATECGRSASHTPQVTVHLTFATTSFSVGFSAGLMSTGQSSLKPLIITDVAAVRGYF